MKVLSLLGHLPRWMLTLMAWKVTVLLLLVGGYRGKVVRANLLRAFPRMSMPQRWWIYAKFQRHFVQLMVESAKLFSMRREDVDAGIVYEGKDVLDALHASGKHVLLAGGHMNNWEWCALTLNQHVPFRTMGLYKQLSDKNAEKLMRGVPQSIWVGIGQDQRGQSVDECGAPRRSCGRHHGV